MHSAQGEREMNENWDLLRDFLALCREGSVTRAAKVLGVRQSTVSRRLIELEEALGVQLFFRVSSGVEPTEAALALVPDAEMAEQSIASLRRTALGESDEVRGLVRVATSPGLAQRAILPTLSELYQAHPGLRIDIITGLRTLDLSRSEADIALRFVKPSSGDLIAKPVADLHLAVLAHRDYRKKRRTKKVKKLDWIGLDSHLALASEFAWMQRHVPVQPRFLTNDYTLQLEAIRHGLGVALLPRSLCNTLPELVEVSLDLPMPPPMRLWLVMHRNLRLVSKFSAVWSFLQAKCATLSAKPG
ncbi:MAG: LysR family transcriptional regulator [Myxococcales bacterium]|nr:LysR family transcriptional regulator [Myxococcales bacterium]